MSRKPVEIPIASDTRQFSKAVASGVIDPLEDAAKALDEVAKESDKASDSLVDMGTEGDRSTNKLEDALRDAQRETQELKDDSKKLHDTIEKGAQSSYRKMAKAADDGYDKSGQAAKDFKDEAKSNASEMASSFDGSMDSVAGAAQGLMGGLVANGGPIALASAGIALAGGAFYTAWKENAEKTKQEVSDMYDDLLESGESFLSDTFSQEQYWKIVRNDPEALISRDKAQAMADQLGIPFEQLATAVAKGGDQLEGVLDRVHDKQKEVGEQFDNASQSEKAHYGTVASALQDTNAFLEDRNATISETIREVEKGRVGWKVYGSEAEVAIKKQQRQMSDAIKGLGSIKDAAIGLPDKTTVKVALNTKDFDNGVKKIEARGINVPVTFTTRDGRKFQ